MKELEYTSEKNFTTEITMETRSDIILNHFITTHKFKSLNTGDFNEQLIVDIENLKSKITEQIYIKEFNQIFSDEQQTQDLIPVGFVDEILSQNYVIIIFVSIESLKVMNMCIHKSKFYQYKSLIFDNVSKSLSNFKL